MTVKEEDFIGIYEVRKCGDFALLVYPSGNVAPSVYSTDEIETTLAKIKYSTFYTIEQHFWSEELENSSLIAKFRVNADGSIDDLEVEND